MDRQVQVLLQYLNPADTAALRLVSRSWQAVVDGCLSELQPFAVTTCFSSTLSKSPCLAFGSPFHSSSVRHHPLDLGPSHALYAIAGQFTCLHTLSVNCANKSCSDFQALCLIKALRRLHLSQFSFDDDTLRLGPGRCVGLQALHLNSQQAWLQLRSLRHLTALAQLQELVLLPRGYIEVPAACGGEEGLAALRHLSGLTHLALLTSLRTSRNSAARGPGAPAPPVPTDALPGTATGVAAEGQPVSFSVAAVQQLSGSLSALKGLKVLRLAGAAALPRAVTGLTQLHTLSLERLGWVDRTVVNCLCQLQQLTALTVISTAGTTHPQQQQQQALAAAAPINNAAEQQGAAAAAAAAAVASAEGQWSWMPLLGLPRLQVLVLGSVQPQQQLNLTGNLTEALQAVNSRIPDPCPQNSSSIHPHGRIAVDHQLPVGYPCSSRSSAGDGHSAGGSGGSRGSSRRGGSRRAWGADVDEEVGGYVCPSGAWSDMAQVKGLQDIVVVRSWHSAAVTAVFPSFAAAVAAYMTWPQVPTTCAPHAGSAAALQCGHQQQYTQHGQHNMHAQQPLFMPTLAHWLPSALSSTGVLQPAAAGQQWGSIAGASGPHITTAAQARAAGRSSGSSGSATAAAAGHVGGSGGAVGVFVNHPNQGCFMPSLPQLMVLCFWPSLGSLGPNQRALAAHLLQLAGAGQLNHVPGSRMHLSQDQQGIGGGSWVQAGNLDRWLLLAQLRASMHPSKLLLVLGASATSLTRLELTVDQSWSPSVLASLGQLEPLKRLAVLHLDCGRQQPAEEMWQGLSRLTSLRWLCLRWLDRLPVLHLKPLTNLVALQLKNIDKPPGVAQLAEALHGMQHLTALSIEGAVLDADEDWLRDMAGLLRHGRWTSSWVEHLLCREYHLRVLGSITAALLMSALLNSPKWPEMLFSALLAAVAGAMFVMAVAAAIVRLLLNPQRARQQPPTAHAGKVQQQLQRPPQLQQLQSQQAPTVYSFASSVVDALRCSVVWGWVAVALQYVFMLFGVDAASSLSSSMDAAAAAAASNQAAGGEGTTATQQRTWLSFLLRMAAVCSRQDAALSNSSSPEGLAAEARHAGTTAAVAGGTGTRTSLDTSPTAAVAAVEDKALTCSDGSSDSTCSSNTSSSDSSNSSSGSSSSIDDPGSAFRRLRFVSLRRCTLSHSNNTVSDKLWQLSVLASQLAPGLGSQLVAVSLALVLWPLAVAAAISRIVATSGSFHSSSGGSDGGLGGSSGSSAGGYAYSRRSMFAAWAWGWDLVCGLLQGAANRVEGAAAAGCGPVVAVASNMPELRFLDLTWVNLEPWELHAVVQLKQLHYLGLSRQQVQVVMSKEAVFARNCSRGRRGSNRHRKRMSPAGAAAHISSSVGSNGGRSRTGLWGWLAWLLTGCWWLLLWPLWLWRCSRAHVQQQRQQPGAETSNAAAGVGTPGMPLLPGACEEWPSMVLVESPSGFDEVLEHHCKWV